ncbi:hypothetical protein GOP47_0014913 [Adiantum capillus-veneris]|uniref:Serine hydroxymethyltransferase n=1 Tax=Adiantum capillus-veneris TaxID=13818 RepID=A0A9D4ZEP5_ADICA|nr:hypothetical protein GOP47_0014913 [Adiantum capillus-veneris]
MDAQQVNHGFDGSVQGDFYCVQPFGRDDLSNGQQKDDVTLSGEMQRESKRRKEGGNQGPYLMLPAYGNQHQGSLHQPSPAAQLSFQQALLQHALQGLHQSHLPEVNQSPQLLQRSSSDVSARICNEPINPSLSRLPSETGRTGASYSNQRSPMEAPHNKLPNEASSHLRTSVETKQPSPSTLEAVNNSFTSIQPTASKLSNEGSPRSSFQNGTPSRSGSTQASAETTHLSCLNASSQYAQAVSRGETAHAPDLSSRRLSVKEWGSRSLSSVDPHLYNIMEREKVRQWKGIELIASENFTSQAVMEVLGSHLVNKYSEGLPGARYYGGNEYIDQIESLCRERALISFHLDSEAWGVNVQPYSCTSANFAVYTALLQPKDRIMGLDSPSGGHLSHGYYTPSGKKVSAASIFFENLPYKVNPESGYIDYDKLEEKALDYRPKILICGGSAYPREWDYARFRQISDKVGAILMCDMAHISGLVAAQECRSPFDYCDIVTTTTHKSLRGPRGGMIFYRKGLKQKKRGVANSVEDSEHYDFEDRVNFAIFPSLQGGPHNNQVAALAVALKQVATPEFKAYIQQVKKNAQALRSALQRRGCKLVTDGTDNHLLLWDLRSYGLTGYRYEKVCETCHITLNKNAVFGDSGTYAPGGVRIGTPAMTSRGCVEADFEMIAELLLRALQIALGLQREHGKQNKEFLRSLQTSRDIEELKQSVEKFASSFEMPGFDTSVLKSN